MFRSVAEIDEALHRLGRRLLYADAPAVTIVVCGGSGLHMLGLSSRTTRDIDICAAAIAGETSLAAARNAQLPAAFLTAVEAVARDLGLSPGWLNTAAGEVLDVYGPPDGLAERLVMRDYGPTLRAGFLSRVDQVHFKMLAAADPKAPERHMEDLRDRLQPSAEETATAARWLLARQTSAWFRANIRKVVEELEHADIAHQIPR